MMHAKPAWREKFWGIEGLARHRHDKRLLRIYSRWVKTQIELGGKRKTHCRVDAEGETKYINEAGRAGELLFVHLYSYLLSHEFPKSILYFRIKKY